MTRDDQLSRLLTDAGFPETDPDPDLDRECTRGGYETRAELLSKCSGRRAAWRALVRRDFLTVFDTEGDFREPLAHSRLLMVVLRALRPFRSFDDSWSEQSGLVMVSDDVRVHEPPGGGALDHVMLDAVLLMAGEVARSEGSSLRPCALKTNDQTAAITLLPQTVAGPAFEQKLLVPAPPWQLRARLVS